MVPVHPGFSNRPYTQRNGDEMWFEPCVPAEWPSFKVQYRYKETVYHIEIIPISDPHDQTAKLDGVEQPKGIIKLIDDKGQHVVSIKCPTFARTSAPQPIGDEVIQNGQNEENS